MGVAVERVDPARVASEAVEALGLDADSLDLRSDEALAASVRRAASFLCPTPPGRLVRAVTEVLAGLPTFEEDSKAQVERLVEALVSYGDLLELPMDDSGGTRRHLFLGPPAYVRRSRGCVLLGVRPEGAPLISEELLGNVDYNAHLQFILSHDSGPVDELLAGEGLMELRADQWLKAPRELAPGKLVDLYARRLDAAGPSGDIEGLRVIDPTSNVGYYRGRWRPLKPADNGRFVARRPQAFGADLWCFTEIVNGEVARLIDLPLESPLSRGSDEAWRLQAALDALAGGPQQLRVSTLQGKPVAVLDVVSPLPSWSQRRLDLVGTPVPRRRGALFSYALSQDDVDEETHFLESMMWLSVETSTEATSGQ